MPTREGGRGAGRSGATECRTSSPRLPKLVMPQKNHRYTGMNHGHKRPAVRMRGLLVGVVLSACATAVAWRRRKGAPFFAEGPRIFGKNEETSKCEESKNEEKSKWEASRAMQSDSAQSVRRSGRLQDRVRAQSLTAVAQSEPTSTDCRDSDSPCFDNEASAEPAKRRRFGPACGSRMRLSLWLVRCLAIYPSNPCVWPRLRNFFPN